jgi:hypothetical protein
MTLNTANSPSVLHISPLNLEAASTRRRNTVGSPTSAEFKPGIAHPQAPTVIQHSLLPLPSPGHQPPLHLGKLPGPNIRHRSKSPSHHKAVLPHTRRQNSRSPERGIEQVHGTSSGGWFNGRRSEKQYHLNPKSGLLNMQGRRNDVQQPITVQRPSFRRSPQSMSLPSTPNHHPRHLNGVSRSPSPPACMLDSPRSAASEPASTASYSKAPATGCLYETLLVDARRRMPYSLGIDKLKPEKPKLEFLPQTQEEALTKDMEKEFERLKPSSESEIRRRKFLGKLSRILNEEWPGHDTKVHAFGSTENHLCMDDSDGKEIPRSCSPPIASGDLAYQDVVDVCITTKCKEVESTCKLAAALAKRGSSRQLICQNPSFNFHFRRNGEDCLCTWCQGSYRKDMGP